MRTRKVKINLHITESCNMGCLYCFAKFDQHSMLSTQDWKEIILNIHDSGLADALNFAGGEPLLYKGLMELVHYAKQLGLRCSIITNASLMDDDWIISNAGEFDTIGISADSFTDGIMQKIGRCDRHGNALTPDTLAHRLKLIKAVHPNVRVKINTVVNRINLDEDMAGKFISLDLPVDRWKLLKITPFDNGCHNNSALMISDEEYFGFVRRQLSAFGMIPSEEDACVYNVSGMEIVSERELRGGYVMIDAGGYLVDDTRNSSYTRIIQCQQKDFAEGLNALTFIRELYDARYAETAVSMSA